MRLHPEPQTHLAVTAQCVLPCQWVSSRKWEIVGFGPIGACGETGSYRAVVPGATAKSELTVRRYTRVPGGVGLGLPRVCCTYIGRLVTQPFRQTKRELKSFMGSVVTSLNTRRTRLMYTMSLSNTRICRFCEYETASRWFVAWWLSKE